jgi:hypothetical protein
VDGVQNAGRDRGQREHPPDSETGIAKWSEQQFLDKFYQYKDTSRRDRRRWSGEFHANARLAMSAPPATCTGLSEPSPRAQPVETHPGYTKKN